MVRQAHQERTGEPGTARAPSRQGLVEYLLVTGFLLLAAAGAVAIFGDELRAFFGVRPAPSSPAGATQGPPR